MSHRAFVALILLTALHTTASAQGVSKAEIVLGQTPDFNPRQSALVKDTTAAAKVYFDKSNSLRGVNVRNIVLTPLDDGYDAKGTVENATKLIDERQIFALTLPLGTANSEAVLPILADERETLLIPVNVLALMLCDLGC